MSISSGFWSGIVNLQIDEYFGDKWNRTLATGHVFENNIHFNEIDGIEGDIVVNSCGKISMQRDRDDINAIKPKKEGLQMGSDNFQISSVAKRNAALGCKA